MKGNFFRSDKIFPRPSFIVGVHMGLPITIGVACMLYVIDPSSVSHGVIHFWKGLLRLHFAEARLNMAMICFPNHLWLPGKILPHQDIWLSNIW